MNLKLGKLARLLQKESLFHEDYMYFRQSCDQDFIDLHQKTL